MPITAFLTDSTLCIGCKACEVACKEWNGVSEDGLDWSGFSYDNTGAVGALDVEARQVCRECAGARVWRECARVEFVVVLVGCLQAL